MYGLSLKVERHPGGSRQLTIHEGLFAEGNPLLTINTTTGRERAPKFILRASVRALKPSFVSSPDMQVEFIRLYDTHFEFPAYIAPDLPMTKQMRTKYAITPGWKSRSPTEISGIDELVKAFHARVVKADKDSVPVAMVPRELEYRIGEGLADGRLLLQVFAMMGLTKLMYASAASPRTAELIRAPGAGVPGARGTDTPESSARRLSTHLMQYWQMKD